MLVSTGDVYFIHFGGDPASRLEIRRAKTSPLRDVAGLLRSFDYAAAVAAQAQTPPPPTDSQAPLGRFVTEMSGQFYDAYRAVARDAVARWVQDEAAEAALLDLFLLEKSAHEICFEAANRPGWLGIPLRGLAGIATRLLHAAEAV